MARCSSYPHEWNGIVANGGVVPRYYRCDGELVFGIDRDSVTFGAGLCAAEIRAGWHCSLCGEFYDLSEPRVWLEFDSILDP